MVSPTDPTSIYPAGQCTDYCANTETWVTRYGNLGNALSWANNWRNHGGTVNSTPSVNAVACFQPGCQGAFADGHVAVVRSVSGSNFEVSEENGPAGPGRVDNRACHVQSCVVFLVSGGAPAPAPKPPAPSPAPSPAGNDYIVVSGDTMSGIAQKLGVSLAALEAANPQIKNPNVIFPGEHIKRPGNPLPPPAPQKFNYVWVNGAEASRIGRGSGNIFWRNTAGQYINLRDHPVVPPSGALYKRVPA